MKNVFVHIFIFHRHKLVLTHIRCLKQERDSCGESVSVRLQAQATPAESLPRCEKQPLTDQHAFNEKKRFHCLPLKWCSDTQDVFGRNCLFKYVIICFLLVFLCA